jgi:hypothetical protein
VGATQPYSLYASKGRRVEGSKGREATTLGLPTNVQRADQVVHYDARRARQAADRPRRGSPTTVTMHLSRSGRLTVPAPTVVTRLE